jgi:hypothetical protein
VDARKGEKLCVKMGEDVAFVKNYISQVRNDQIVWMCSVIKETRRGQNAVK